MIITQYQGEILISCSSDQTLVVWNIDFAELKKSAVRYVLKSELAASFLTKPKVGIY